MPALHYVVLHHTGIPEPHYDLMVERASGSGLMTWRCPHWPPMPGDSFTALAEHRREYLEYQGPVSNHRGEVIRVAAGICDVSETGKIVLEIRLEDGSKMRLPAMKK